MRGRLLVLAAALVLLSTAAALRGESAQRPLGPVPFAPVKQHGQGAPKQEPGEAHRVLQIPGLDPKALGPSYAGFVPINATGAADGEPGMMFYWLFEAEKDAESAPLVLWLSGGPGCSSTFALLFENGPFTIDREGTLETNPFSWHKVANVLWVDQPLGTGFSYVSDPKGYTRDERTIAEDLYWFMQGFFALHPRFYPLPFYIFGESYAGHYVPAFAARILTAGAAGMGPYPPNLKGIGIGNGMTDPVVQYGQYSKFAYAHGLIDANAVAQADAKHAECAAAREAGQPPGALFSLCNEVFGVVLAAAGPVNVYDVRDSCVTQGGSCYQTPQAAAWLAREDVQEALHVIAPGQATRKWEMCDMRVYEKLRGDWFVPQKFAIPLLLEHYKVLVYAGDMDLICNHMGQSAWLQQMEWTGRPGFLAAPRRLWALGDALAGYAHSSGPLTYLVVRNAGHMVPMDQPRAALEMLRLFVTDAEIGSASASQPN
eukprot:tig00021373_g21074.t1